MPHTFGSGCWLGRVETRGPQRSPPEGVEKERNECWLVSGEYMSVENIRQRQQFKMSELWNLKGN